ncbi:MAG: hypothetical protein ACI3XM_04930 [Eubacteriales bacterium]
MKRSMRYLCALLWFAVLLLLLTGCGRDARLLPAGGYDYSVSGDRILGYPIPVVGKNPMYVRQAPEAEAADTGGTGNLPSAYRYDGTEMRFYACEVSGVPLALPGDSVSVYCAAGYDRVGGYDRDDGGGRVFFETVTDKGFRIAQGAVEGCAVVSDDTSLYLADETAYTRIAEGLGTLYAVLTEWNRILYTDADGLLYEYRGDGETVCLSDGEAVSDAWYALGCAVPTVVYRCADSGVWYTRAEEDAPQPCILPDTAGTGTDGIRRSYVLIRGTASVLYGNDTSSFFADIRTGERIDMDMGGLYRFPIDGRETDSLPLSPDGIFVYLYDVYYIYRMNLQSGTLDITDNEAPMVGNSCILHSVTPVTDEIVLLSQAAAEYTEYAAVITCAVFDEDLPEMRHEDEKIDLDTPD